MLCLVWLTVCHFILTDKTNRLDWRLFFYGWGSFVKSTLFEKLPALVVNGDILLNKDRMKHEETRRLQECQRLYLVRPGEMAFLLFLFWVWGLNSTFKVNSEHFSDVSRWRREKGKFPCLRFFGTEVLQIIKVRLFSYVWLLGVWCLYFVLKDT